ncbi:putative cytoplasmic protein, partial [Pseudomonas syringae pv. actinidiae ICMP 19096]
SLVTQDGMAGRILLFPEHARFNNIAEATVLDSLFLMRCALRHNKIFATWSFRNERPTIYGRSPAVCFTDMPLAAFVQSSNERLARGENVGRYAFMIPKAAMFSVGARPVIYGLSQPATERRDALPNRVFDNDVLPIGDERTTDWTHEREWRWRYQDEESHSMPAGEDFDDTLAQMPGLSLGDSGIHGMGVLVQDQDDVPKIVYDVLTMVDAGIINQSMIRFVIPLCKVEQHGNIQDPSRVSDLIKEHTIDLSGYFSITEERVEEINNEVDSIIRAITTSGGHEPGDRDDGYGKSWVWIPDNGSELARAMLAANRLIVSTEGRYLLDIAPFESLPVGFEEHYCKRVAQGLATEFEVNATYFTVRDSLSCDGVPYYTDFHDKHHPFYNSTKGCY